MDGFRLFARITKVDAAKRLVWGLAASEAADKAGERFDYESSAPEFRKWSAEIAKGSQGKSLGNVRVMHQPVIGGVLTELDCDDAAKAIRVCAKVVSDDAWHLVDAGALTGFSIGGRYAKRWADPQDPQVHRYTAIPSEIIRAIRIASSRWSRPTASSKSGCSAPGRSPIPATACASAGSPRTARSTSPRRRRWRRTRGSPPTRRSRRWTRR
jgi:hypothetical protein